MHPSGVQGLILRAEGSESGRAIRKASLMTSDRSVATDMLPPLFEPVLVKMTANQMTLHGYQIHSENGMVLHYAQAYRTKRYTARRLMRQNLTETATVATTAGKTELH